MTDSQWKRYVTDKLDHIDSNLTNVRIEVALLKGKAAIWGSVSAVVVAGFLTYVLR